MVVGAMVAFGGNRGGVRAGWPGFGFRGGPGYA
jgi:hypothetical protein